MTIEQKAKAYDEALERMKSWARGEHPECFTEAQKAAEFVFPELKESEDEKIRNFISNELACLRATDGKGSDRYEELTNAIAWLEKQGEQKSIWHNEDEEPQIGSLILLIMQSGTPIVAKIIEPHHTFNHGERWAYIDDLLEKQGEQNPAWSEEDETKLTNTVIMLKEGASHHFMKDDIAKAVDWLKSLKDRYTWKPSVEQIVALRWVLNHIPYDSHKEEINGLLEQFIKLYNYAENRKRTA